MMRIGIGRRCSRYRRLRLDFKMHYFASQRLIGLVELHMMEILEFVRLTKAFDPCMLSQPLSEHKVKSN